MIAVCSFPRLTPAKAGVQLRRTGDGETAFDPVWILDPGLRRGDASGGAGTGSSHFLPVARWTPAQGRGDGGRKAK